LKCIVERDAVEGNGMSGQMRWPLLGLALLAPATVLGAETPPIGWQEAVARLAAERTRAETCAGVLKKYGDEATKAKGELTYGEANTGHRKS
jgi:hypothetical protein